MKQFAAMGVAQERRGRRTLPAGYSSARRATLSSSWPTTSCRPSVPGRPGALAESRPRGAAVGRDSAGVWTHRAVHRLAANWALS